MHELSFRGPWPAGAVILALTLGGCAGIGEEGPVLGDVQPLVSPAADGSQTPHLSVAPDGRLHMSWFEEREAGGHALRWAAFDGEEWTAPATIAEGDSFFVNWADYPTLLPLGEGRMVAHYPWKSGGDVYAYDVRLVWTTDGGRNWQGPLVPHDDGTPTEHGFVSLVPEGDGARVVWLDGRNFAGAGGHGSHDEGAPGPEMTLRSAWLGLDGRLESAAVLDGRVCDCCQTDAVRTGEATLVAYRDRSSEEVRDLSLVRSAGAGWSEPFTAAEDGWKIAGCPVNGGALDAHGERVAMAWYTEAADTPRVRLALSTDGGGRFSKPVAVDGGGPVGRVDVVQLPDGSALVSWVEEGDPTALVRLRRVRPDGVPDEPVTVAPTSSGRASGFPRMVRAGDVLYFAWTEVGDPSRVRVASARLDARVLEP